MFVIVGRRRSATIKFKDEGEPYHAIRYYCDCYFIVAHAKQKYNNFQTCVRFVEVGYVRASVCVRVQYVFHFSRHHALFRHHYTDTQKQIGTTENKCIKNLYIVP